MKKSLLYALPITLVLGSAIVFAMVPKKPEATKNTVKESTVMTTEASPEPTPSTEPQVTAEPTVQSKQTVQTVPQTKTIDELVLQYQWRGPDGTGSDGFKIMTLYRWPQYFTAEYMETSFAYIYDVGLAYIKQQSGTIVKGYEYSIAIMGWNQLFNRNPYNSPGKYNEAWIWMGQYTGVDTSRYE